MDESLIDSLGDMVVSRFRKAREAKMPHYNDMMDCLKLMNGQPLTAPSGDGPDIVMDISSPIVKNIVGLIRDIFVGSTAQPYTINATPVVDLPEDVEAQLLGKIERELETFIAINGGDVGAVRAQVTEMRQAVQLEENRKASVAADRLRTIIADRLYDADWEAQFIDFIDHFCIYPAAIMKAPAVNTRTTMRWDGTTVSPTTETVRQVENISPFDFFPAPYATDIQTADYVIERRRLTRNELLQLGSASGYDVDVIAEVFEANPNGAPLPYGSVDDDDISDTAGGDKTDIDAFDALGYYGRIRNDLLAEYGIEFAKEEMHGASEAEVWVVGGRVIKCLLNPDPLGRRPFYKACFEKVPSSFWGASPAMKLRDTQRVCTASVRALVRNMQYSSGPIGEVRKGAVKDGHAPNAVIPHTIRVVEEDNYGSGAPAYRFYTVPSLSNELVALFDKFMGYGYELIGIPRVAFGSPQGLGTLGRTAGGVSIILNQSTKAIKQALRMIESGLIEPVVQDFINYEIRTSNDPDIRGDIRVFARGVSGLMEQEGKNGDLEWALQSISSMVGVVDPATQKPVVPITAVQRILYTMFKNKGLSTEGIFPDFDRQEAFGELTGQPMPQDPAGGVPDLQGRSPNAEAAIAAANGG
mgnify:CR=1 FL=1